MAGFSRGICMRYVHWARTRIRRLLIILLAIMIYFLLLIVDALAYFPHFMSNSTPYWLPWMRFGFSAFVALMFLAVGALVWLYARSRLVALLLFCFSFTMMVTFAVETDAALNDTLPVLSTIGTVATVLALFMLSTLLLLFPKNLFLWRVQSSVDTNNVADKLPSGWQRYYILLLRPYLAVLTLVGVIAVLHNAFYYFLSSQISGGLQIGDALYSIIALIGILITIIFSYRQSSSLRERQQQRIFVGGVILAVAPLLLLTVIPQALGLPSQYIVDSQLSTLTLCLLPLALGYTILRYQILVFDMYIRRAVAWMVGGVSLAVVGYFAVMLSSLFLSNNTTVKIICVAAALVILGPCVWWLAHVLTGRLFFNEMAHYHRLVDNPDLLNRETFNLQEASELLTLAVVNAFETQEVCLFVLDEDTGCYQLSPALNEDDLGASSRRRLLQLLIKAARSAESGDPSLTSLES